jgi:N-methylhydantoinase A/oxoprolinase/acetone carboxylase beta subunit
MRIGIDVGGTNTDAVLVEGDSVLAKVKTTTSGDVTSGIVTAVERLLDAAKADRGRISAVMIGTTHFTNAVVERRNLSPTAIVRLGLPATQAIEPFEDWPDDLRNTLGGYGYLAHGGNEFDGRPITPLDEAEIRRTVRDARRKGAEAVAVAAVFAPIYPDMERQVAALVGEEAPDLAVSLSHDIGLLGLLERENAAAINASLQRLAKTTVESFRCSLHELGLRCPLYLTQNDGTLMQADYAQKFPVLTFASGPTNSMRGAAFLSGVQEALVLDIGGTTSDVGALRHGFPCETAVSASFAGVRTNFRMPDLFSLGLGGGSRVRQEDGNVEIGPDSVGSAIREEALVFGGRTLTATDLAVAAGLAKVGDPSRVESLDQKLVRSGLTRIQAMITDALDRMKSTAAPVPLVLVGGGSILVQEPVQGMSTVIRPPH